MSLFNPPLSTALGLTQRESVPSHAKIIKFFLLIGLVITLNILPKQVRAACTVTPTNPLVYTFSGFDVPPFDPGVPTGTVLHSATVNLFSQPGTVYCPAGIKTEIYRGTTGTVDPTNQTYPTQIAGVGTRIRFGGNTIIRGYWPQSYNYGNQQSSPINSSATLILEFVKTGPITSGGKVTGEIGGWFVENGATQVVSILVDGSIGIVPQVPTCSVTVPSINVQMGNVPAGAFTGVGSSSPSPEGFDIDLSCSQGDGTTPVSIYTTLTDATNPANRSDVLSLSANSQATGVGIQIMQNGKPLSYGPDSAAPGNTNQWLAGSTTGGGSFKIPLTASYIQTQPNIRVGSANGVATFTMSYQ